MAVKEINRVREIIDTNKAYNRSAWDRGVKEYAHELLDSLEERIEEEYIDVEDLKSPKLLLKLLLNGAENWKRYSDGGCSLICDRDIAKRVCSPSQFKKSNEGLWKPNRHESWFDVQARALYWANFIIREAFKSIAEEEKGE